MIGPGHVVGHFSLPPPHGTLFWWTCLIHQTVWRAVILYLWTVDRSGGWGRGRFWETFFFVLGCHSWAPHKGYMPHLLFYKLSIKTIEYGLMIVLSLLDFKLSPLLRYTRYTCVLSNSCFISALSWSPKAPCDTTPPAHSFPIFPSYYLFESQLMVMLRCFTSGH